MDHSVKDTLDPVAFGQRLYQVRTEASLTQQQFAEHLQVTQSSIAMLEHGQRKPGSDILYQLYRKFHGSFRFLLTGSSLPQEPGKRDHPEVTQENISGLLERVQRAEHQMAQLHQQLEHLQDRLTQIYADIHQQFDHMIAHGKSERRAQRTGRIDDE